MNLANIFQVGGCIIRDIFSKINSVVLALAELERAQGHVHDPLLSCNFHLNYLLLWCRSNTAQRYHYRSTARDSSITGTL